LQEGFAELGLYGLPQAIPQHPNIIAQRFVQISHPFSPYDENQPGSEPGYGNI
jgi:hypothetical protein